MAAIDTFAHRVFISGTALVPLLIFFLESNIVDAQEPEPYKKRVLESTEVDILGSFYSQKGDNAAVTGGIGTEELKSYPVHLVVAMPLTDDDVLTVDLGVSAYSSASSSNLNPFDGDGPADPYVASSGASGSDVLFSGAVQYSHATDNRNNIFSLNASISFEYDYFSIGFGGGYARLFNNKNTELSINANVFLDDWNALYPYELRGQEGETENENDSGFNSGNFETTGNPDYDPQFVPYQDTKRNTYSLGLSLTQILSRKLQGSLLLDLILQDGLLANHMQRVYFSDIDDTFVEDFHLADDVERLPDKRFRFAVGSRLNYYINEIFVLRTLYRFYTDTWGIFSHTAEVEVPIRVHSMVTIYPTYRFYHQTEAAYFAPYNRHNSTDEFYTSDYDLSEYNAHQYGLGVSLVDALTRVHVSAVGLKSVDVRFDRYQRDTGLKAFIITGGIKFVIE